VEDEPDERDIDGDKAQAIGRLVQSAAEREPLSQYFTTFLFRRPDQDGTIRAHWLPSEPTEAAGRFAHAYPVYRGDAVRRYASASTAAYPRRWGA